MRRSRRPSGAGCRSTYPCGCWPCLRGNRACGLHRRVPDGDRGRPRAPASWARSGSEARRRGQAPRRSGRGRRRARRAAGPASGLRGRGRDRETSA
ncbi:hypothetical protein MBELCI_3460 [Limimaricola cinnabarinus LL-001]|uniref:Uncharacterized protein n=1 Tax=Limimaricola cinnabarinus LL-001 TaxID=1337093 RepID=U3ARQ3_9RHOB|nr:hypothetical protein MBELCI_3460 [Limimaricola cinnabarinus LL-001]